MKNLHKAPIEWAIPYAMQDIEMTRTLKEDRQRFELENQELNPLMALEMDVTKALVEVERRGIPVDHRAWNKAKKEITSIISEVEIKIFDMAGFDVNVRSGPQMVRAFEALKLPIKIKKETKNPTFDKYALQPMGHPFTDGVLKLRSYRQIRDAFIDGLGQYIHDDDKVYTTFNQTKGENDYGVRSTGRLSSSEPNMQQSPKRNREIAALVRSIFRAQTGQVWYSSDWSQFEFRIFAHYTNYDPLTQEFIKNPKIDFHQIIADMANIERDPAAKRINLGLIFGMGEGKMAKELNLPYSTDTYKDKEYLVPGPEAKALFNQYHEKLPNVKPFLKMASNLARSRGWVKTIYGRRIRFPRGHSPHKAGGVVFQGTAADIMKKKLVIVNNETRKLAPLVSIVHDEFNNIGPKENKAKVKKVMKEIMEDVPELRIPILADIGTGSNWWKACQ